MFFLMKEESSDKFVSPPILTIYLQNEKIELRCFYLENLKIKIKKMMKTGKYLNQDVFMIIVKHEYKITKFSKILL